jgi:hypothetical protein
VGRINFRFGKEAENILLEKEENTQPTMQHLAVAPIVIDWLRLQKHTDDRYSNSLYQRINIQNAGFHRTLGG